MYSFVTVKKTIALAKPKSRAPIYWKKKLQRSAPKSISLIKSNELNEENEEIL